MNIRFLLLLILSVVPVISPAANEPKAPARPETELEGKMDRLNGAFRKLRRQVSDATKNEESLALVAEIRRAADESLALAPAKAADLPEADRAKFIADYRERMKVFIENVGKLEAALKSGNNEEAAKMVAVLGAAQREGHKQFRKPSND
jgi:soluble cytochrome b562